MSDQTFLDSLEPGDNVAVRDRKISSFGGDHGYRIYTVEKISPKRTKFSCKNAAGESVDFDKHGGYRTGAGFHSHYFDMEPVTEEILVSIRQDTALIKAKRVAEKLSDAIGDFARSNPNPARVDQFLESCSELKVLFGID